MLNTDKEFNVFLSYVPYHIVKINWIGYVISEDIEMDEDVMSLLPNLVLSLLLLL